VSLSGTVFPHTVPNRDAFDILFCFVPPFKQIHGWLLGSLVLEVGVHFSLEEFVLNNITVHFPCSPASTYSAGRNKGNFHCVVV
jgi:hypothetical protein